MNKFIKIFFWSAGILVLFLLAVLYLSPRLINSDFAKDRIEGIAAEKTGGSIDFQKIDLFILPRPHAIVREGTVSVDAAKATVKSVSIYPKIFPLFRGKLQIARLFITSPHIRFDLPEESASREKQGHVSYEEAMRKLTAFLTPLAVSAPDLAVISEGGRLSLLRKHQTVFLFQDISLQTAFTPAGLKINISGSSGLWEKFSADLSLNPDDFRGEGQIDLERFKPGPVTDFMYPEAAWSTGESTVDMSVNFKIQGPELLEAELQSAFSQIELHHKNNKITINGRGMQGKFVRSKDQTRLSLAGLELDYPRLRLSGELLMNRESGQISLSLEGRKVDAASTREAALAIAGDSPVVKKICHVIRGGSVPVITFHSQGGAFGDLRRLKNIVIEGSMSRGKIFVPKVSLDLDAVNGDVVISKGILEGRHLEADLGKSHGWEGALKIGLRGKDAPFHLDMMIQTDMAQLHPLLKRLVKNKPFVDEISLINSPKGKVAGRLVLGESLKAVKVRVDAEDADLSAGYRRVPFPVEMHAVKFYYDRSGIIVKNLRGKTGRSFFSDVDFRINFHRKPFLEILSGTALIFMDETYPWFSKLVHLPTRSVLRSPFPVSNIQIVWEKGERTSLKGSMSLQRGPRLTFDMDKTPEKLDVRTLTIRDEESDAALSASFRKGETDLAFAGTLTGTSVDSILSENEILEGWVRGDIKARIMKDRPAQSTAQGHLEGSNIHVPLKLKGPVDMESIALDAEESRIRVVSADMNLWGEKLKAKGDVNASDDEFVFDLDVDADGINWDDLKHMITPEKEEKDTTLFYDLPVRGTVRLDSAYFTLDRFTFRPFHAAIAVRQDNINVADIASDICGISTTGNVSLMPRALSLDIHPHAKDGELEKVMECLFNVKRRGTGAYDLEGGVTGRGEGEELVRSFNGNLEFHARDGRIYRGGIVAKILAFINLTEIFRGTVPDLVEEGFAYRTMSAHAGLSGDVLHIDESVIDGSSMTLAGTGDINIREKTIDLDVLVAPLKTADFIIKQIPLVREITGGTLISIPVKVKGDISDPEITYIHPEAVGSRLLEIMTNTIQAPFKLIGPIIPDNNKDGEH